MTNIVWFFCAKAKRQQHFFVCAKAKRQQQSTQLPPRYVVEPF
ncbi:hypothetical protein [Lysinibacillus sp. fls2-241-R2A-57]|nr:hypothetical protein [Lysinibacillus sp. fls2-241-R2A-57]